MAMAMAETAGWSAHTARAALYDMYDELVTRAGDALDTRASPPLDWSEGGE